MGTGYPAAGAFIGTGDERNPQGVKLISSPSGTGLSAKLDRRVWDNQQYHIVRVVRYPNGNVDEYRKGEQIPLNLGDVVKVPLFSYEKAGSLF